MSHSPMLELFAEELKIVRAAAGMTQAQLAEEISYSAALVGKIESCERRPSPDFARRCDKVLETGGMFGGHATQAQPGRPGGLVPRVGRDRAGGPRRCGGSSRHQQSLDLISEVAETWT